MKRRRARMFRVGLIALLVAAVALPGVAMAAGGAFTDDDTSIFEADIEWMADAGITKGCNPPDNTLFCPDDFVTRGQMAAFMRRFAQFLGAEDGMAGETHVLLGSEGFGGDLDDVAAGTAVCETAPYTPSRPEIAIFNAQASGVADGGGSTSLWLRAGVSADGSTFSNASNRTSPEQALNGTADGATSYTDAIELSAGTTYTFAIVIGQGIIDDLRCNLSVQISEGSVTQQP